jgi:hypothetical protein
MTSGSPEDPAQRRLKRSTRSELSTTCATPKNHRTALPLAVFTAIPFPMKTSIDIPDDLYRQVKAKSALEGRAVREVASELFAAWVQSENPASRGRPAETSGAAAAEAWIAEWERVSADITAALRAKPDGPTLVEQLNVDRR